MKIKVMGKYKDGRVVCAGVVEQEWKDKLPRNGTFQFRPFGPRFQVNTGKVLEEGSNRPHRYMDQCWYEV